MGKLRKGNKHVFTVNSGKVESKTTPAGRRGCSSKFNFSSIPFVVYTLVYPCYFITNSFIRITEKITTTTKIMLYKP
ncbi:hypothetical protein GCM10027347_41480 [Larkinella harenae]